MSLNQGLVPSPPAHNYVANTAPRGCDRTTTLEIREAMSLHPPPHLRTIMSVGLAVQANLAHTFRRVSRPLCRPMGGIGCQRQRAPPQ
jgi:hypothetical protein